MKIMWSTSDVCDFIEWSALVGLLFAFGAFSSFGSGAISDVTIILHEPVIQLSKINVCKHLNFSITSELPVCSIEIFKP